MSRGVLPRDRRIGDLSRRRRFLNLVLPSLDGHLQKAAAVLSAPEDILTSEAVLNGIAGKLGTNLAADWKEKLFERVAPVAIVEG